MSSIRKALGAGNSEVLLFGAGLILGGAATSGDVREFAGRQLTKRAAVDGEAEKFT